MDDTEVEAEDTVVDPGARFSSEDAYQFLSDTRRRYAIHYLKQQEEPVSVRDLAEQVAAWENGKAVDELSSQERKRVYIALYQSHLPSMDKEGAVDYDSEAGTVELSEALSNIDIYLEVVPKEDIPWNLYYLGLSIANATVLVLAWLEIRPFDLVPDLGWAALVLVTFAASALAQTYIDRRMRFGDEGPPPELRAGP